MSKKKNTLKDLDEFLRQQAATIVPPAPVAGKTEETAAQPKPVVPPASSDVSFDNLVQQVSTLTWSDRNKLYDIIIQSLESTPHSSPEDKMLINTALYLKSGSQWKEVIREYWRKRTHPQG